MYLIARMWSILVNVPWDVEKNVYYAIVLQNSLCMSTLFSWLMVVLGSTMSLLILCMLDLFWERREVSNYDSDSSFSLYNSISFCIKYFDALLLVTYTSGIVMSSWRIDPFIIMQCSFLFLIIFFLCSTLCLKLNITNSSFFQLVLCISLSFVWNLI